MGGAAGAGPTVGAPVGGTAPGGVSVGTGEVPAGFGGFNGGTPGGGFASVRGTPGMVSAGVSAAPGAGAGVGAGASTGCGAMSGGGPPRPTFCCVPMKIADRSSTVSSCVRTMCGVSSITMSDWVTSSLVCPNSERRIGMRMMPGNPVRIFRCSSRSRPASSVDSPSRSRSFVPTFRELNDGTSWPATLMLGPSELLSTRKPSSTISPS